MTIYAKNTNVGIDERLLTFQRRLESIGWANSEVYGRIYVTQRGNNTIAEAYVSDNDYKEIFVDDTKNAVFGFIVGNERGGISRITTDVTLICSLNLDELYGSATRNDEEAILTVISSLHGLILKTNERQIRTGLENVFEGLSPERFRFRDMQPFFNFSITFGLSYNNNICKIL